MASRTIDDFDSRKPSQRSSNRAIDDDETLRIVDQPEEDDFGLEDDTDPGDRRRDPLRVPH